jgi:hypothetical protein
MERILVRTAIPAKCSPSLWMTINVAQLSHIADCSTSSTAHAIGWTHPDHGIHGAAWLNGSQFGVLSCEGSNDDSNVQITGAVMALSELKQIDIAIEDQRYDEVSRRVSQWTRRATFSFSGKKDFSLKSKETPDQRPDKTGDFIDRVLLALVSFGQPS